MPLLLYCMIEAELQIAAPARGVQEAAVQQECDSGLCCFYSGVERLASDPASVKAAALQFHQVVSSIFAHAAVIPFRFPTLVADVSELTSHLREHTTEYGRALVRLRGMVQMEVRISGAGASASRESGAEYLRSRQKHGARLREAASSVRKATQSVLADWRERETNKGWRCYGLVTRGDVAKFQEMIGSVEALAGVQIAVTGPWPATEFIQPETK